MKSEIYKEKDLKILLSSILISEEEEINMDNFVIEMHVYNNTSKIISVHKLANSDWELYNKEIESAKAPVIENPPLEF